MTNNFLPFDTVKKMYPDKWVLLGKPEIDNTRVLVGSVLYHIKDKKEVCYIGSDKTQAYSKVTIAFKEILNCTGKLVF
jgi:hypothetical protein